MTRVETPIQETAEDLREWIQGLTVGSVSVRKVTFRFDGNASGELALFFDLTLSDPSPGAETWPLNDVLELHSRIDDRVGEANISLPWHVTLQPESPDEPDPEDLEAEEG